jgi:hypothetical protein
VQTALALIVVVAVIAIGLGRRIRTVRGLACACAAVVAFTVVAWAWFALLMAGIVPVDRLFGVLRIYRVQGPAAVLLFWGPPGLAALATVLALRRWTERT